jgi:hypothetical protein
MRHPALTVAALLLALGSPIGAYAAPPFDPGQARDPSSRPVPEGPSDASEPPAAEGGDAIGLMSGVAYLSSDQARRRHGPPPAPSGPAQPDGQPVGFTLSDGSQYTLQVTNDAQQDVEPSVRTLTIGSTNYTTAASIKFLQTFDVYPQGVYRFRNYFATTTNFSTWTRGMLPMPAGYTQSGDPYMDENSYTSGIAPLRKYVAGIIFQDNDNGPPNAIGVWHSDDGGLTWSLPTLAVVNTGGFILLDKPSLYVSQWSGDLGAVFVAYIRVDNTQQQGATNTLYVVRSTDGGITFSAPVQVTASRFIEDPIVLTSPFGDKVYVVWVDYALGAIRMSTSTESLASWTAPETGATGSFVGAVVNGIQQTPNLNGGSGVRAATIPMARYNWVDNSLGVVWHEYESPSSPKTDVFFVSKDSSGWHPKKRINPTTLNDQFMPGFDFDTTGRFMVTYYDRSQDPNNLLYKESWVRIDYLGNVVSSGALSVPFSNPAAYYPSPENQIFIGDYQDSWWWTFSDQYGNRFNACWVEQTSSTTGDIYVTGIQ